MGTGTEPDDEGSVKLGSVSDEAEDPAGSVGIGVAVISAGVGVGSFAVVVSDVDSDGTVEADVSVETGVSLVSEVSVAVDKADSNTLVACVVSEIPEADGIRLHAISCNESRALNKSAADL